MELSFPRTFAPGSESSIGGTFVPWNFRSREGVTKHRTGRTGLTGRTGPKYWSFSYE